MICMSQHDSAHCFAVPCKYSYPKSNIATCCDSQRDAVISASDRLTALPDYDWLR